MPLERRGLEAEVMKLPELYTLILLDVVRLQSVSALDGGDQCVPLFVRVGETAVIECSIRNADQRGVYLYRQLSYSIVEKIMYYYYYKRKTTPEPNFKHRLETNKDRENFSVSLYNVSEHDGGVYWCKFNRIDVYTNSQRTCLLVQSGQILMYKEEKCKHGNGIYLAVIGVLLLFILAMLIALLKLCYVRGNYNPEQQRQQQQPCNGVYEVMLGNTRRTLINPEYGSSQRKKTPHSG